MLECNKDGRLNSSSWINYISVSHGILLLCCVSVRMCGCDNLLGANFKFNFKAFNTNQWFIRVADGRNY